MRNEFFGDVKDYRKYGLLRILARDTQANAAVCWMLRPNKGLPTNTDYLLQPQKWRHFDERLFDALRHAVIVDRERNVVRAEHPDVLHPAVFSFYKEPLKEDSNERRKYFDTFLACSKGMELVFFDPDIGLEVRGVRAGPKRSPEYLYFEELSRAFDAEHSILVFQFFMKRKAEDIVNERTSQIFSRLDVAEIASFKTRGVIFLLISQAKHLGELKKRSEQVRKVWGEQIQPSWHSRVREVSVSESRWLRPETNMKKTQQFLGKLKLPGEDNHSLKPSDKRFPDGGQYRIEIPSVEGPRVFREVLAAANEYRVPIHRVSQGSGIMLLTKDEISEMARIGAGERIEVCLFVGPRASFETGAQSLTTAGKVIGLQHRGADQLVYAVEDVRRACELGIRSVLPADLGLIWVLNEMKKEGELPKNLVIKSSVTLPAANPATAKIFESLGVTTMNVPTDLSPAHFGGIRQAVDIPIDTYIEVPDNFGGFIRYYEMPQLVQVAAPMYLKFGLRNAPDIYPSGAQLEDIACRMGRERVRRARIALDLMERYAPEVKMSPLGSSDLGIPEG